MYVLNTIDDILYNEALRAIIIVRLPNKQSEHCTFHTDVNSLEEKALWMHIQLDSTVHIVLYRF
jgi:hypothetical protein